MQILKEEKIDGNIYSAARRMHELVQKRNEKVLFQDSNFDDRFAFLVGPKDSLDKIEKIMLKHIQNYFDVEEWDAYRKSLKLLQSLDKTFTEERQVLLWLKEFIPLANTQFVQHALDFDSLFGAFNEHYKFNLNGGTEQKSPFSFIINDVMLDLSLGKHPRMHVCELIENALR